MKIKGPRSIRPSKYCVELYKIIDDIGLTKNIIPAKQLPYVFLYEKDRFLRIP